MDLEIHKDVVVQALAGNGKAMEKLYSLYNKSMYNICCRIMNNTADAEDMLQETFIEAFRRLETFRFDSTFGAWLKRIAINKCINELRRKKVQLAYGEIPDGCDPPDEDSGDVRDDLMTVERIRHAMALLPDGYRVVFSLYMMEGYDHDEIASILGISSSTSKTQMMRAKNKIIEILKTGDLLVPNNN